MKGHFSLVLLSVLACLPASPARAAWIPNVPGWSVREVPLEVAIVGWLPYAITLDPLSGDVFALGSGTPDGAGMSLLRISQAGEVQNLAPVASSTAPPIFDPVHRVVLVPQGARIARFTETGAPLSSISGPWSGPVAYGPDGELYSASVGWESETLLQIMRYDSTVGVWVPVRDVPLPTEPWPTISYPEYAPDQFRIDNAWRMLVTVGSCTLFRIDESASVFLGSTLLEGGLATGSGMVLIGPASFDPSATTATPPQWFAAPPPGHRAAGVAAASDGSVIILSAVLNQDGTQGYALEIFTMGPTPAVQRSWGSLKGLAR